MNKAHFQKSIKDVIAKCSYEFYIVQPDLNVKCTCVDITTKEPTPTCKKCLSTGYKIKIRKIKGAADDKEDNVSGRGVKGSAAQTIRRTYFVDSKYPIKDYDLIVDGREIFYIFRIFHLRAIDGEETHKQIFAIPKRNDHTAILNNFNEIMDRYRKGKKK